jgi:membrane-bound serine protease (ClpP class)
MVTLIVALVGGGVALLILENFVPGFVVGTLGVIAMVSGVVLTYLNYGFWPGNGVLAVVTLVMVACTLFWIRNFHITAAGRYLTHRANIGADPRYAEFKALLGKSGTTLTPLHPAGAALIDGKRVDVVTQGELIGIEEAVRVILVEGARVVVARDGGQT